MTSWTDKIQVIGIGISKEDTETIKQSIIDKVTKGESE